MGSSVHLCFIFTLREPLGRKMVITTTPSGKSAFPEDNLWIKSRSFLHSYLFQMVLI